MYWAQKVNLLPGMPTSHIGVVSWVPDSRLLIQLPVNVSEAADEGQVFGFLHVTGLEIQAWLLQTFSGSELVD